MSWIDWLLHPNKYKRDKQDKPKKGKKGRKGKFKDYEEEEIKFVDDPVVEQAPEKLQKPTVEDRITVPKGKAFINVDKRSWAHLIMGLILVTVNLILLVIGTVGWVSRWEEKVLVSAYAIPSIYVTMKYTWIQIQGERIHELD